MCILQFTDLVLYKEKHLIETYPSLRWQIYFICSSFRFNTFLFLFLFIYLFILVYFFGFCDFTKIRSFSKNLVPSLHTLLYKIYQPRLFNMACNNALQKLTKFQVFSKRFLFSQERRYHPKPKYLLKRLSLGRVTISFWKQFSQKIQEFKFISK